jgi:hypothetical protein
MSQHNGTVNVIFHNRWPLAHLKGSFVRHIHINNGRHTFVRQPHPQFQGTMWLFLKAALDQGQLIGTSEACLANYAENGHGVLLEYPTHP